MFLSLGVKLNKHSQMFQIYILLWHLLCRIEDRFPHHFKYILRTREEKPDCVPPIIISGHRFTAISQHQSAARDYLEAYKLDPENPLINLCVGMSSDTVVILFSINMHRCISI